MALNLSDEERAECLKTLKEAEPYQAGDPELDYFDGEVDPVYMARMAATLAKYMLDKDDREKAALRQQN